MYLKKGYKIFFLLILFFISFLALYFALFKNKNFEPRVMVGKQMPNLSSSSLFNNQNLSFKSIIDNEIFVVNIFASWCAPCKIEHPFLMKLKRENIKIIGINYKDNEKNAKKFLNKYKNPYSEVLLDKKGILSINLGAFGVPETYLIDKNFIIIDKYIGPINNEIAQKILSLK